MMFCCQPHLFAEISYLDDKVVTLICGRLWEKMAQILVTLTSPCDFHFKQLNMNFIENKLIVDLNSNCHDCSIQRTEEKLYSFRQTDMVEFLIMEENCQRQNSITSALICQQPLI